MRWPLSTFAIIFALAIITPPASAGSVKFAADVPTPPTELPLLKLTPQPAPIDLMNRLLKSSKDAGDLMPLNETPYFKKNQINVPADVFGIVQDDHVKAWTDKRTGDAAIYPALDKLEPIQLVDTKELISRSREIFESTEFIARDDTRFVIDKPQVLKGSTLVRDETGHTRAEKPTASYLVYISARRVVAKLPVDGPGSRALLIMGGGGSVEGLTRVWKAAKKTGMVRTSLSEKQVRKEIMSQLQPMLKASDVVVDRIELAYYDANREFLQPVYRFTARLQHQTPNSKPRTDDDFVIGYVPFAKAFEQLPLLNKSDGPKPSTAAPDVKAPERDLTPKSPLDPIVGRYVVRNDDAGWVNNANAFWNSLSSTWTGSLFTNSQYYWAEPRLFTNQKDSFINAMNLALIEVHGDWWLYSTHSNCCDLVNINGDIPSPGYGPSASGQLADWIIHSCEVVPGPDDTGSWPDPWWRIFGGVRNVVGYRTIMYINDGAGGPYGTSLGNLAPVVSSWLSDVMSLNAYSGHPTSPAHGGIVRPMGRPSTISMCGRDGDSVLATSSLGRADCLTVWWFPD